MSCCFPRKGAVQHETAKSIEKFIKFYDLGNIGRQIRDLGACDTDDFVRYSEADLTKLLEEAGWKRMPMDRFKGAVKQHKHREAVSNAAGPFVMNPLHTRQERPSNRGNGQLSNDNSTAGARTNIQRAPGSRGSNVDPRMADSFDDVNNEWHVGETSAKVVAEKLYGAKLGCYVVRKSTTTAGAHVLVIVKSTAPYKLAQLRIIHHAGCYHVEGRTKEDAFPSLRELVASHRHCKIPAGGRVLGMQAGTQKKRMRNPVISKEVERIGNDPGLRALQRDRDLLEIGDEIQSGHFGVVFEATYNNEESLALKSLRENAFDKETRRAFLEEAKIMLDCKHVNVLGLYGVFTRAEPWFIASKLSRHADLHGILGVWEAKVRPVNSTILPARDPTCSPPPSTPSVLCPTLRAVH